MEQKKEKNIKPINNKHFSLFFGLFLCILTFVLIMDIGYVARTFTFLPNFLFGYGNYVILLAVLLKGISLVFSNHDFKIKHYAWIIAGIVVMMVGISCLISLTSYDTIYYVNNFSSIYVSHFNNYYSEIHLPFLFQIGKQNVGGGYIGYFLSSLLNTMFNNTMPSYLFSSLVIVLGLGIGITPFIIDLIKFKKTKRKKQKAEMKQHLEEFGANNPDFLYEIKDKSNSVIKNASKLEKEQIEKTTITETQNNNDTISSKNEYINPTVPIYDTLNSKPGGISRAYFKKASPKFIQPTPVENKKENIIENSYKNEDVIAEILTSSQQDVTMQEKEQIEVKKENKIIRPIDEKLAMAMPEFKEPIAIKKVEEPILNVSNNVNATNGTPSIINKDPIIVKHKFIPPSLSLLAEYDNSDATEKNNMTAEQRMTVINNILNTFNIKAQCCGYVIGPSVTRYNIEYFETTSSKDINNKTNDISIRLGGIPARFESIVPGTTYSGLEIPNAMVTTVGFKEILEKLPPKEEHPMAVAFGKNITGEVIWSDLYKMPHMLLAGTTGSGKSIFIHSIVMTLIMRNNPDDLRLVLVDPKRVEMSKYKGMPHLLCPNIVEPEEAVVCLNKLVDEMERRYSILEESAMSDIQQYNEWVEEDKSRGDKLPYYVAILDEYSDLVDRAKDIQRPVISLAQKARSAGIHLIICTQRPSTNVITGLIKGNLPTHVALMTASSVDSITIIGEGGAEKLLGKGDMLVQSATVSKVGCVRLQGCFVQNKEILQVVDFLKSTMTTDYHPDFLDLKDHSKDPPLPFNGGISDELRKEHIDERYEDVKASVMASEYASISRIQREFGFGFSRAGKIFQRLVNEGIVEKHGTAKGSKVLIHDDYYNKEANVGSEEVSSLETIDEYIKNAEDKDGGY